MFDSVVRRVTSVARLAASELVSRVDRFVDVDRADTGGSKISSLSSSLSLLSSSSSSS